MNKLYLLIFSPLKWIWSLLNYTRKLIFNLIFIFIIILIFIFYLQIHYSTINPNKSALILDINGYIVEKPISNKKLNFLEKNFLNTSSSSFQENSLFDLINKIRQAKTDKNITGIILSLKNFLGADQVSLQYIGKVLKEFRNSGKPIYAIGDRYTQAQYFLASFANKIYLTPYGEINLNGMSVNNLYYKSFLDKLKINVHVFRVGTYKSAVEPFLRDEMSDEARQNTTCWLSKLWNNYLKTVSSNRKCTIQQFFPNPSLMFNEFKKVNCNSAQFALNNKWIDVIASRSDINKEMIKKFGINKSRQMFNGISIYDYDFNNKFEINNNKIAVILVNGAIVDGYEISGLAGGDSVAEQIREARLNPNIKALILRVNSPGGSVTASEVIRTELEATRLSGKPIVVSMGSLAASGGYWISTPANYIIASTNTLTGSIGIFGVINTIENLLDELGIHYDGISTTPLADISVNKALPNLFSKLTQLSIKSGYDTFVNLVAHSRNKTYSEVNKIGQGQIWIGKDALKNGLIDQLGDFDDAINKAVELSKLNKYELHWYINEPSFLDLVFNSASYLLYNLICKSTILSKISYFDQLKIFNLLMNKNSYFNFYWNDPKNIYAFCLLNTQLLN